MTFSTYDGAAPSKTWDAVTDLYVSTFSATPYGRSPLTSRSSRVGTGPARPAQRRMTIAHRDQEVAGFALVHALVHDEPWQTILTAMAEHPAASDALERPDRALIVHELAVDERPAGRASPAPACTRCCATATRNRCSSGSTTAPRTPSTCTGDGA